MCDKILLVVRHNDQTDQIFKTIIAPFLAAFLHTFQRWQRLFSSLHSWKHWLMFHPSCKTMYKVLSYIHNLVWELGQFVCIVRIVRWVILGEGYCKRDSHQISDLPEVGISAKLYSLFLFLVLFQSNNFIYESNHINEDWSKVTL